jgi:4'-phosphopantetheinyl transferase
MYTPRLLPPGGPPAVLDLDGAEPDLWLLRVSHHREGIPDGYRLLDATERTRHARFLRAADRDRYVVAHIAFRHLLAYTRSAPATLRLSRLPCPNCGGPHGRPALPGGPVHFSPSRTGDLVLFAFATVPVGVDVEALPDAVALNALADTLHPWERSELDALLPAHRSPALSRCWTRKEAYLKGVGIGLAAGTAHTYTGTGLRPARLHGWSLWDAPVDEDNTAAVALSDN